MDSDFPIVKNIIENSFFCIFICVPKDMRVIIRYLGSGALPGRILDLGLSKISWVVIFLFLAPAGGFTPNPFPNHAGLS